MRDFSDPGKRKKPCHCSVAFLSPQNLLWLSNLLLLPPPPPPPPPPPQTHITSSHHHDKTINPHRERPDSPITTPPLAKSKQTLTLSKCGLIAFNINGPCKTLGRRTGDAKEEREGGGRLLLNVLLFSSCFTIITNKNMSWRSHREILLQTFLRVYKCLFYSPEIKLQEQKITDESVWLLIVSWQPTARQDNIWPGH